MSVITFGGKRHFWEIQGCRNHLALTVTNAGVVIVVLLSGALECTRTQWDKLKILRMFVGDVFLWNVSKQLVISCAHGFTGREFTKEHMDGR